jgi:hypothetical protein
VSAAKKPLQLIDSIDRPGSMRRSSDAETIPATAVFGLKRVRTVRASRLADSAAPKA